MDCFHSNSNTETIFPLESLIQQFSSFKGIGHRTAQRLALEAVTMPLDKIEAFAANILKTKKDIKFCKQCFYLTWTDLCHICEDTERVTDTLCIVSEPKDVLAIERSGTFKGRYHVLGGVISPLDGIYPEMLRFQELTKRLKQINVQKIVLALSPTVEGDTTILYLKDLLAPFGLPMFKLAQGIPIGSDMGYLDEVTIDKAFEGMMPL